MPLIATRGAASAQGFGEFAQSAAPVYIEDVFSTYLYTGNGSTQTITNGIDLSTKGGLVWIKWRNTTYGSVDHNLYDTSRGVLKRILSNTTDAQVTQASSLTAFNSDGFSLGGTSGTNGNNANYVSWTFREQPKFFDVVTYTGTGSAKTVAHNLGSVPGCIIVKATNSSTYWATYHTSLGNTKAIELNTTNSAYTSSAPWNNTSPTSTQFTVGTSTDTNDSGITYIAYLFAHNAGGFGLTGTDNVISCGSAADGNSLVTLGYEPQWVLIKGSQGSIGVGDNWLIADAMRGMVYSGNTPYLAANLSSAEDFSGGGGSWIKPTATGFQLSNLSGTGPFIYIAIRRGPMKVPTSGTSVFSPAIRTGTGSSVSLTSAGFPPDLYLPRRRDTSSGSNYWWDRLRGSSVYLASDNTNAEVSGTRLTSFNQTGVTLGSLDPNASGSSYVDWYLRRAPSFFDEVCYTGTGVANTAFTHNLTVTPELMIVKPRSAATAPNWRVWSPINSTDFNLLQLSTNGAASSSLYSSSNVFPAIPTATTFTVGGSGSIQLNESGQTFVAYLFATCAGVSKCGTFTGNGSSQTINCGFTGGARFVMIKATSTTGDWMVADSARGIVSGSDPYLELNNTNAEVTGEDWLDTDSTGFVVNEVSGSNANTNGVTYIFLAIA